MRISLLQTEIPAPSPPVSYEKWYLIGGAALLLLVVIVALVMLTRSRGHRD